MSLRTVHSDICVSFSWSHLINIRKSSFCRKDSPHLKETQKRPKDEQTNKQVLQVVIFLRLALASVPLCVFIDCIFMWEWRRKGIVCPSVFNRSFFNKRIENARKTRRSISLTFFAQNANLMKDAIQLCHQNYAQIQVVKTTSNLITIFHY